jgi:RNA recognition motif-containing protein
MTKLYVGNLPYSTNDQSLADVFSKYGNVLSATVITDKMSGRSKGFGFVELEDDSQAQTAIKELNGTDMDGRKLNVSVARPMEERPRR